MQKKKILYVITKSNWGGAQRYVFDLATNLPENEFDAVVVTGGNGPLIKKFDAAGVKTIPIPYLQRDVNILKELLSFLDLLKIFRAEKPDIIHLNSSKVGGLGALAAFVAKLTIKNYKPKTVFTVHGWAFKENRSLLWQITIFLICWFSSLFQDKIILVDTADFETAKKFIPLRKLVLIFNGIGKINFLPREEARIFLGQKKGGIESDTILIGTIAELIKNKGLNYLIDAAELIKPRVANKELRIIIIGDGEDREKLQKQIKSLGLEEGVFITGFVPDARHYLKALDIFVLPSLKEGLPYSVLEAMAAGLPIIASQIGGIPDLIEQDKEGLLVPPKDSTTLADIIIQLYADAKKRQILGNNARKKLETDFPLNALLEKTIKLYEEQEI